MSHFILGTTYISNNVGTLNRSATGIYHTNKHTTTIIIRHKLWSNWINMINRSNWFKVHKDKLVQRNMKLTYFL